MPTIDELVSAANAIKADAAKKAADENSVLRAVLTEIGTSLADIVGLLEDSNDAEKAERDKPTEATLLAVELAKSLRDAMAEVRIEVQAAHSRSISARTSWSHSPPTPRKCNSAARRLKATRSRSCPTWTARPKSTTSTKSGTAAQTSCA